MIRQNPVIVNVVEKLFCEEQYYSRAERRSLYRRAVSRPIAVRINNKEIVCFSKNLSFDGIGLVSHIKFEPNTEATIEIHSTYIENPVVAAKLAWCKDFGEGWYISGWQFLALVHE